jgi:hypothetical protein
MSKSRQKKADIAQKLAAELLRKQGYLVETPIRTKWHREDFFSAWDIIAVKKNKLRFIQVSTLPLYDRGVAYKKKLKDFPVGNWTKEYWQVKEAEEPRIWKL